MNDKKSENYSKGAKKVKIQKVKAIQICSKSYKTRGIPNGS